MDEKFPLALPEGTILAGQYMIEKVLGQGGFGITYRAVDHKTNQKVAVKEFFPDTLAYRETTTVISYPGERSESYEYGKESFLQEAQTLAEFIGNENIVRIHSYFEENGTAYFVMDYIEGKSFDEYLKERGGKISTEEAKNILVPVMDALNIVHSKGIVHRDVTPDNIYITNDGSIKLLDFGAARYSLGDKSRSLDVILKHGFAPKEQYTRRGKQGPFTDIYALGATFYFAITGKRPPDSVERLDEDDLIPPSTLGVDITEQQESAILKALNVQPADRFQTMADFKSILLSESNVKNRIVFTAPKTTEGNQEQPTGYQQTPAAPQAPSLGQKAAPLLQRAKSLLQKAEPLLQKLKQMKHKKLAVGIVAGVLVVVFLIGRVGSNGKTSENVWLSSSRTSNGKTESQSSTGSKTDAGTSTVIIGNTPANIKNSGTVAGVGNDFFFTDEDSYTLYSYAEGKKICENMSGRFSSLSYDDGVLYFLCDGKAYKWEASSETEEVISELKAFNSIERLYITDGFYFIYSNRVLYRISQRSGAVEDSMDMASVKQFSFYDGWLYFIENSNSGTTLRRASASNFENVTQESIYMERGRFEDLVIEGDYVYVSSCYPSGYLAYIYRFPSNLKLTGNECIWDISELVGWNESNNKNSVKELNIIGDNLFFYFHDDYNGKDLVYHMVVKDNVREYTAGGYFSDYDYEQISSTPSGSVNCLGVHDFGEHFWFSFYGEQDGARMMYYVSYDSSTNSRIETE